MKRIRIGYNSDRLSRKDITKYDYFTVIMGKKVVPFKMIKGVPTPEGLALILEDAIHEVREANRNWLVRKIKYIFHYKLHTPFEVLG